MAWIIVVVPLAIAAQAPDETESKRVIRYRRLAPDVVNVFSDVQPGDRIVLRARDAAREVVASAVGAKMKCKIEDGEESYLLIFSRTKWKEEDKSREFENKGRVFSEFVPELLFVPVKGGGEVKPLKPRADGLEFVAPSAGRLEAGRIVTPSSVELNPERDTTAPTAAEIQRVNDGKEAICRDAGWKRSGDAPHSLEVKTRDLNLAIEISLFRSK